MTAKTPTKPAAFYQHLLSAGSMSRGNPELARLAELTGYSLETIFKVATGQRRTSKPLALAIVVHAGNPAITLSDFTLGAR